MHLYISTVSLNYAYFTLLVFMHEFAPSCSGIEVTHSDFGGRARWGADFVTNPAANKYRDENGHGTHVTGGLSTFWLFHQFLLSVNGLSFDHSIVVASCELLHYCYAIHNTCTCIDTI